MDPVREVLQKYLNLTPQELEQFHELQRVLGQANVSQTEPQIQPAVQGNPPNHPKTSFGLRSAPQQQHDQANASRASEAAQQQPQPQVSANGLSESRGAKVNTAATPNMQSRTRSNAAAFQVQPQRVASSQNGTRGQNATQRGAELTALLQGPVSTPQHQSSGQADRGNFGIASTIPSGPASTQTLDTTRMFDFKTGTFVPGTPAQGPQTSQLGNSTTQTPPHRAYAPTANMSTNEHNKPLGQSLQEARAPRAGRGGYSTSTRGSPFGQAGDKSSHAGVTRHGGGKCG